MAKSYSDKLKDPRWQKKRLEILSRDNFTCQSCYDNESTLHVHHKAYFKGKEPWDISNEYLITLCESCHEWETENWKYSYSLVIDELIKSPFLSSEMKILSNGLHNYRIVSDPEAVANAIALILMDPDSQMKAIDLYINRRRDING